MQVRITRCHLTLVRVVIIEKTRNNKWWKSCGEKDTSVHCWWDCKLVQSLWKTVWRYLKKLRPELPNDPFIPLLGIFPKNMKTLIWKIHEPNVCGSIVYNSQDMETIEVFIDGWNIKEYGIYIYDGILLNHVKDEIMPFVTTWLDLEGVMLSKISQMKKDK